MGHRNKILPFGTGFSLGLKARDPDQISLQGWSHAQVYPQVFAVCLYNYFGELCDCFFCLVFESGLSCSTIGGLLDLAPSALYVGSERLRARLRKLQPKFLLYSTISKGHYVYSMAVDLLSEVRLPDSYCALRDLTEKK